MSHRFYVPVMGTGFTNDSPLRIAHFGIDSVISLVDDKLIEQMGIFYAQKFSLPYEKVLPKTEHARAERIRRYLNLINILVQQNFARIQAEYLNGNSEKDRYFQMLPTDDPLRIRYLAWQKMPAGLERSAEEKNLTAAMCVGSIDVNIMVKLDRPGFDDAKEALRGYAESTLCGNTHLVLSAGINQSLFSEMEKYPCFYRNQNGGFDKKIVLKISDFRSAMIQGKFLARKGLEVSEFRVESGMNCGGHLFPSPGETLPKILGEIKQKKESLGSQFLGAVQKYYAANGLDVNRLIPFTPQFSVQGGVGNYAESEMLMRDFGMNRCGWGTPFLLVPEATLVDDETRKKLAAATEEDFWISHASPLGVPFSNLRTSSAECARKQRICEGHPGSICVKGFLQNNTEFTDRVICTASREYQKQKVAAILKSDLSEEEKKQQIARVYEKSCICHELGNSALIALGLEKSTAPVAICPGPNIAYFNRLYTLAEMTDYIYGRRNDLAAKNRPPIFEQEEKLLKLGMRS